MRGVCALAIAVGAAACSREDVRYARLGIPTKDDRPDLSNVRLELEKGPCGGECPMYSVSLAGTGRGAYTGTLFVATTGHVEFTFDPNALERVLDVLEAADFMGPHDKRGALWWDAAYSTLTLSVGDRSQSFSSVVPAYTLADETEWKERLVDAHAAACAMLDEIAGTARWVEGER